MSQDDEKPPISRLHDFYEEMTSSDRAKFLQHATKDLPSQGCEGQMMGTIIGVWMSRGVCPDCLKRILCLMVDTIFADAEEAGMIPVPETEDDDDGK
jgi:hypothetical protein